MKKLSFFFLFFFLHIPFISISQSNFVVTSTGTNATIDDAIDYAVNIWDQYIITTVPVKLHIEYLDLTNQGPLGITLPNGRKDFTSSPQQGVWYASCLANSLEGAELNIGEADINVFMNSANNYYFGTDGNPSFSQYDFISVLLHEIAHGLGVVSLSKVVNHEGSFGNLVASDFAPLTTTFPFPDLEGLPSVWDNMIINNFGENITDTLIFQNNSAGLKSEFESNELYFTGSISTSLNLGVNPKVFAPSTYDPGSSLSHIDESAFPASSGNSMMTPFTSNGAANHYPGPLLLALLQDIGWQVNATAFINEQKRQLDLVCYPNPVITDLAIQIKQPVGKIKFEIYNQQGQITETKEFTANQFSIDMSSYTSGVYFLRISSNDMKKVIPITKK